MKTFDRWIKLGKFEQTQNGAHGKAEAGRKKKEQWMKNVFTAQ